MINCNFSSPVNYLLETPTSTTEAFNWAVVSCTDDRVELIENATTGSEFYIQKTLDYGTLLILIFISLFLFFTIFKFLWRFVWDKKV